MVLLHAMTVAVHGRPMVCPLVAGAALIIALLSVPIAPILAAGAPKLHELHSVARGGDLAAVKVRTIPRKTSGSCSLSAIVLRLADADRRWWDRQRARWRRVRCSVLVRRRRARAHRTCKRLGGLLLHFVSVVVFFPAGCPRVPSSRDGTRKSGLFPCPPVLPVLTPQPPIPCFPPVPSPRRRISRGTSWLALAVLRLAVIHRHHQAALGVCPDLQRLLA
jgi:hypothetical protein